MKILTKYFEYTFLQISRCLILLFTFSLLFFTFHGYSQDSALLQGIKTIENAKGEKALKNTNSVWDVLFNWDVLKQSQSEAGVETDGTYIYTARYNSTSTTPQFYRYTMSGAIVDSFQISGVVAIRDLSYDGTYFYGGSNGAAIYEMDFTSHTLISTITCPAGTTVRHIAYDPLNDAFWVGGWNAGNRDFKLIDRSGLLINSIPEATHGLVSVYGTAYDGWTAGGPYLWAFDQGLSGEEVKICQINIATGQQTGISHDCVMDVASGITSPLAGGLFTFHNTGTGTTILGGCIQIQKVFGYDLSTCITPSIDAGVVTVSSPVSNCGLSSTETVNAQVKNFGSSSVSGFNISYQYASYAPVTEQITQSILPGQTINHTFSVPADFSTPGTYLLKVYTSLTNDESAVNDTAKIVINHLTPSAIPFNMGFESTDDLSGWTIWDQNNDNEAWFYFTGGGNTGSCSAAYEYSSIYQADDWIISSCIDLVQGMNYNISFYYKATGTAYYESLALYYGNLPVPDSMTTMIVDLPSFNNITYLQSSSSFTAPVSGSFYFGWHAYSQANMWKISLDDINISSIPAGLENVYDKDPVKIYLLQENNLLHIESENIISSLKIWNVAGQVMYSENKNFITKDICTAEFISGIYMIQAETDKGKISKKILINK
jgi:hypothetical protein